MALARELIVQVMNRPGNLSKVGNALRERNVNIIAILATGLKGMTPIHMMVDDVREGKAALENVGFEVEERRVVTLELENRPGTLGVAMDKIALKGINIDYCYYSVTDGKAAYVVLGVQDPKMVESLLK